MEVNVLITQNKFYMNIENQYLNLLQDIIDNGVKKETRNGVVRSLFGRQIRHNFSEGFPLLTTKKMSQKNVFAELKWFLSGSTDIRDLWKMNCHIWDNDWYNFYSKSCSSPYSLEEMKEKRDDKGFHSSTWSLGNIYGKQWRDWFYGTWWYNGARPMPMETRTDQIAKLIEILKTNPDDRRMLVSAWNVGELDNMALPPCHFAFQVWTRELTDRERDYLYCSQNNLIRLVSFVYNDNKENSAAHQFFDKEGVPKRAISLMWSQRSGDAPLGIPYNIASYATLLIMLAKHVNMVPEELIGSLGDCHIYENQMEGVTEQLTRTPYPLPSLTLSDRVVEDIKDYKFEDFTLENYNPHSKIFMPLST